MEAKEVRACLGIPDLLSGQPPARGRVVPNASDDIVLRSYVPGDAPRVRELFIAVNRLLSPPHLHDAFEHYISRSLLEEIDRIPEYYGGRHGGFWVALRDEHILGMFGLELVGAGVMELRRMYVDPAARRGGIARQMLHFAEEECRRRKIVRLELSTSELQAAALAFYRRAGYEMVREEIVEAASNKTLGGGLRRYYFQNVL
jgi:putative acetyltransferase